MVSRKMGAIALVGIVLTITPSAWGQSFWNWESPTISPIGLTPSGSKLLVVNTADNRLMVFDVTGGIPVLVSSISVGLDPVSVRARTETEVWVVNHISDSISIVDLPTARVVRTIGTGDEPCDVVFAGTPPRAFVTLSQLNQVRVWDPANIGNAPTTITIQGEDPRALAVSADGSRVFAAIFESGNATGAIRQQDVSNPAGPYGGQNPPPNSGTSFNPPLTAGLPAAPPVAQIVRRNSSGQWMDDNGRNWSSFVTWNLHDHDVAIIDTATLAVTYASGLMTNVMGIGVKPDGSVTVVGTEALNQMRFEPNIQGIFLKVLMGSFNPATPASVSTADINPHLNYSLHSVPQSVRDQSIGDPRGIVWHPSNGNGYVAGMGSNNVIVINGAGGRVGQIDVGQGPSGLALSSSGGLLYVLNKFDGSISIIDTSTNLETARVPYFDPTPQSIKLGRPFLYDTHTTSGLGHIACASCHIDGRTDFLAWDLGNPAGTVKAFDETCRTPTCRPWHPMKGPMVTQSLQDIVGVEPFHWRGDRENLAAFGPAFTGLQGADAIPSPTELQLFTDFVATIRYQPSPNRNIDGTMPNAFNVSGGNVGNPNNGLTVYNTVQVLPGLTCAACHALPVGTTKQIDDPNLPLAPQPLKIAQLRGLWEKDGWRRNSTTNSKGFGFNHHSEFDTLFNLLGAGFNFGPPNLATQRRIDVEAFMMCFDTNTHASIGQQITFNGANNSDATLLTRWNTFLALANANTAGLVVKGRQGGVERGYRYNSSSFVPNNVFQSDRAGETISAATLLAAASLGNELTWTVVPKGSETRIGIDRDEDGAFDLDELVNCGGDPANGLVVPTLKGDVDQSGTRNVGDLPAFVAVLLDPSSATSTQQCAADMNSDGLVDGRDVASMVACLLSGACP